MGIAAWSHNPERDDDREEAGHMEDEDDAFNERQADRESCVEDDGKGNDGDR